ncbi:hypothetical protein TNCV_4353991 [Trichonephila clavipes]|nr:hypothetical protein TNCV_4353991 [Trichonephila clavipes]
MIARTQLESGIHQQTLYAASQHDSNLIKPRTTLSLNGHGDTFVVTRLQLITMVQALWIADMTIIMSFQSAVALGRPLLITLLNLPLSTHSCRISFNGRITSTLMMRRAIALRFAQNL